MWSPDKCKTADAAGAQTGLARGTEKPKFRRSSTDLGGGDVAAVVAGADH